MDDPRAHLRAARAIEARIADGTYTAGTRLHIGLIADELGIYRAAVSRGLELLARRGLVTRVPGLGWYVTGNDPGNLAGTLGASAQPGQSTHSAQAGLSRVTGQWWKAICPIRPHSL